MIDDAKVLVYIFGTWFKLKCRVISAYLYFQFTAAWAGLLSCLSSLRFPMSWKLHKNKSMETSPTMPSMEGGGSEAPFRGGGFNTLKGLNWRIKGAQGCSRPNERTLNAKAETAKSQTRDPEPCRIAA